MNRLRASSATASTAPGACCLLANGLDILALAEVAGVGDDVHVVGFVDPFDGHRRIEAAAVCQDHLFTLLISHGLLQSEILKSEISNLKPQI